MVGCTEHLKLLPLPCKTTNTKHEGTEQTVCFLREASSQRESERKCYVVPPLLLLNSLSSETPAEVPKEGSRRNTPSPTRTHNTHSRPTPLSRSAAERLLSYKQAIENTSSWCTWNSEFIRLSFLADSETF